MRRVVLSLSFVLLAAVNGAAQSGDIHELRFTGPSAEKDLCSHLFDARRVAESQGRLDFAAEIASAGADDSTELIARVWMGPPFAIRRISFSGNVNLNDSTLRRAMLIQERDLLDVGRLRRSLERINQLGVFERLTLSDVMVTRLPDGVSADLTLPLRARKLRWWSLSAPFFPGRIPLRASLASRLPPWGRRAFEAATYVVSLNVTGFARPFLMLERPVIPGQELLSGFAITSDLSSKVTVLHYARTQLGRIVGAKLSGTAEDAMSVPMTVSGGADYEPFVCQAPKPRLRWLRRGAEMALNSFLLP
jgi:hypothetical protein